VRSFGLVAICCVVLSSAPGALAHPDIDLRIADLNVQIDEQPNDSALYLKRGELHRHNLSWDSALSDYRRVASLLPGDSDINFYRGRMLLESGMDGPALAEIELFLSHKPVHREALLVRARALVRLGRAPEAVADYEASIALRAQPTPENYLEWAAALASIDDGLPRAVEALDAGVRVLGPLITLQQRAMAYETELGRFDEALTRLDTVRRWLRPERYQAKRAEVMVAAGRQREARQCYEAALNVIEALPEARKVAKPTAIFQTQIESALQELGAGD
jgi:tetratricopeptide (TPR) repeat protein